MGGLTPEFDDDAPEGCRPPLWSILVALVVLIGAVILGVRVAAVLFGLVFPPDPPRPPDRVELSHTSPEYGVNDWRYETPATPCEVIAFYEDAGSTCVQMGDFCADGRYTPPTFAVETLAECTGVEPFSIFALRWTATIDPRYGGDVTTTFRLFSEVLWGGPPE
jgi:hypothetical protein